MISVDTIVQQQMPKLENSAPLIKNSVVGFLKYLFHEHEFNQFEQQYPHLQGISFVEQVLDYFQFGYFVNEQDKFRIPHQGKVVAIANHPIGSLDGLALLALFHAIRSDVKVVANELLWAIEPLRPMLLPVNNMAGRTPKDNMKAIEAHLEQGGALLIFPAGEVSRFSPKGVMDGRWRSGFLRFARKANADILPIHIDGKNSLFFYTLSLLAKPISTLWLIDEMFKQKHRDIRIRIGQPIPKSKYDTLGVDDERLIGLIKKHLYSLPKKRAVDAFKADFDCVAHPEDQLQVRQALLQCELLGNTDDGHQIYCYRHKGENVLMRELGRLRELTFRAVGEGTGRRRDTDKYDEHYDHIILYHPDRLEIVGAYRMMPTSKVVNVNEQLYSATLFNYSRMPCAIFQQGLELGRSFVQPKYWGKRSLDYLWQGIGAYLTANPDIRYLFGPVTITNGFSSRAKSALVSYYQHYYGCHEHWVSSRTPYQPERTFHADFDGNDSKVDFQQLKQLMKLEGASIPTLYKQYTELCEPGGVRFCAFNVDADFCDCIDGLVIVDLTQIKPEKQARYLKTMSNQ